MRNDMQNNKRYCERRNESMWQKRHKKHFLKLVFSIVGVVVVILIVLGGYVYYNYRNAAENSYYPTHRTLKRNPQKQIHQKGALSILFLGTNTKSLSTAHEGDTETMIINTVNPKTNRTTMTSMPKNLKIKYDGKTMPLNQLYNHGGVPAVTKYVQKEMKIPVDYYVLSDMQGLAKTAGQVGGINVTPSQTFTSDGVKFQAGKSQTLDQKKTLAYLKEHGNGNQADYQRQLRNKQVLLALFDKIAHDPLNPSAANSLSDDIHTDLSFNDLERLALHYRGAAANKQHISLGNDENKSNNNSQNVMNQVTSDPRYQQLTPEQKQKAQAIIRQNLGL